MDWNETRPGEVVLALPERRDAGLLFIGVIRTPFATRDQCPRRGSLDGPVCRIVLDPPFVPGLRGIEAHERIEVLYWMHLARRDLIVQAPRAHGQPSGTFALRSPVRPNPIAVSGCVLVGVEGDTLLVRGLDCVDGTPLIDIKPDRCPVQPEASR